MAPKPRVVFGLVVVKISQVGQFDVKGFADLVERFDGRVARTAFNAGNIRLAESSGNGQFFLRKPNFFTKLFDAFT